MEHQDKLPKATKPQKAPGLTIKPLALGDVCYMVCGSCRMAVESITLEGKVVCAWQHFETKEIMRGAFDPVTLSKAQG